MKQYDYNSMRQSVISNRRFHDLVEVDLSDVIERDALQFNDLLSMRATGSILMENVSYRIIDFKGGNSNVLILDVSGDVEKVILELDELQWA